MSVHIESKKEDIAELVLMPGDPLRAKYIAENFLTDYKLVNQVRNMFGYTGYYKGKKITVFASGMGIPSIGIYAYELFRYYDVKKIIRIGTAGSFNKDIKVLDVILSTGSFAKSYYDVQLDGHDVNFVPASIKLNNSIQETARETNNILHIGKTITSDVFDIYCNDINEFKNSFQFANFLAVEMEAFGLFYLAKKFEREASCLLTIVDSIYDKRSLTSEERQSSLNQMITLALDSIIR